MVNADSPSPKRYRKPDLPRKRCLVCGRQFAWRKKWRKVWDDVKTCSARCKAGQRRRKKP